MILFYFIIFNGLAFGVLCAIAIKKKNRDQASWFFIGFFFSIFGLIASVLVDKIDDSPLQPKLIEPTNEPKEFDPSLFTKKCPDCAEMIKLEAKLCRFCQHKYSDDEVIGQISQLRQEYEEKIMFQKIADKSEEEIKRKFLESHWECPWCAHINELNARRCARCSGFRPSQTKV